MRRLNEERYSEMKRLVLDSKLQTAADRRREGFTVRAAVNAEVSQYVLVHSKHVDCYNTVVDYNQNMVTARKCQVTTWSDLARCYSL